MEKENKCISGQKATESTGGLKSHKADIHTIHHPQALAPEFSKILHYFYDLPV